MVIGRKNKGIPRSTSGGLYMSYLRVLKPIAVGLVLIVILSAASLAQKLDFMEPDKAELEMKDNPKQPGAHAMILEWRNELDDYSSTNTIYKRLKIFTQEGKKYADVEIPYFKDFQSIKNLKARTIHPDGKVILFEGQPIDKTIVKTHGFKYNAKAFSLPDVQPGSIVEYMYKSEGLRAAHSWELQGDLFVRKVSIQWHPFGVGTNCLPILMPHGERAVVKNGSFSLEATDITAFEDEEFLPPDGVVKTRLQCWYSRIDPTLDSSKFWIEYNKNRNKVYNDYLGRHKNVEQEANSMVSSSDSPEQKIEKIYYRVQKLRNLTFEKEKTEQEEKREKRKDAADVDDVLKNGYGNRTELNLLFAGMARALGLDASIVEV